MSEARKSMPEDSHLSNEPDQPHEEDPSGIGLSAAFTIVRKILSAFTRPLLNVAGRIRVRRFRANVIRQMRLTIGNLHPDVIIGGTDRRGWYAEIYLDFAEYRVRITRAIYSPHRQDLWADIGARCDPAAFFRMDFVLSALRRLETPGDVPGTPKCPDTFPALDAAVWAVHDKLVEHLHRARYPETKRMIQQVMHEDTAAAMAE